MKNIQNIFLLFLLLWTQLLVADEKIELKNFFLTKIDKIVVIAKDENLTKIKRNRDILEELTPLFDFKLMAKLSLGKRTWNSLTHDDKKKFTKLYIKRMELSYSSKLDTYTDQKVEVIDLLQPKKNRISLITDLVGNGEKLKITYKFYKPKKPIEDKHSWVIYDVEILGVSILKSDKAQFKDFLQTKSISDLMKTIEKIEMSSK